MSSSLPFDPYAPDADRQRRALVIRTRWYLLLYLLLIAGGIWAGVWVFDQVAAP